MLVQLLVLFVAYNIWNKMQSLLITGESTDQKLKKN